MFLLMVLAALQHRAEAPKALPAMGTAVPRPLELILCEGGRRSEAAVQSREAARWVEGSDPKGSWLQVSVFPR